jgi:hypothetical protein
MLDEKKCEYCFGTGQKVEVTPAKMGRKATALPAMSELRRDRPRAN